MISIRDKTGSGFTDIEESTRLLDEHSEKMGQALARHDAVLSECIERSGARRSNQSVEEDGDDSPSGSRKSDDSKEQTGP